MIWIFKNYCDFAICEDGQPNLSFSKRYGLKSQIGWITEPARGKWYWYKQVIANGNKTVLPRQRRK